MDLPSLLYRSVKGNEAARNHFEGNLWFRSHAYFRSVEGGDELEGKGSYVIPSGHAVHNVSDDYPIQPAFFMSFSEAADAAKQYGDSHLRLDDPVKFLRQIKKELPSYSGFVRVEWKKMKYDKTLEIERHPGPRELLQRQFDSKPLEFADEREWRLQIQFLHSFRIQNHTLKFRWPRIGHQFSALVD